MPKKPTLRIEILKQEQLPGRKSQIWIRLKGANGKHLLRTSETYKQKDGATRALDIVINAIKEGDFIIEDLTT